MRRMKIWRWALVDPDWRAEDASDAELIRNLMYAPEIVGWDADGAPGWRERRRDFFVGHRRPPIEGEARPE